MKGNVAMKIAPCWIANSGTTVTLNVLDDLSTKLLGSVPPTDRLRHLQSLISQKSYSELAEYAIDYETFGIDDVSELLLIRQVLAFYQKLECLPLGIDKEQVAYNSFLDAEQKCSTMNALFRSDPYLLSFSSSSRAILARAREIISGCLGKVPSIAALRLRFGPGATTEIKAGLCSDQYKLAAQPSCSEELLRSPFFNDLVREMPHWAEAHAVYSDEDIWRLNVSIKHSKLVFVPKNAKTFRGIMTQPTLNGLLQNAIGDYMSTRLLKAGLNLADQTINQRLARAGSMQGHVATLDLKSASDTLSYGLIKNLMPEDWFLLLNETRCRTMQYRSDDPVRLSQFSSMGNGFTFPLESLVFWSLGRAILERNQGGILSVYGDDIIISTELVGQLTEVLEVCGFTVNDRKSFVSGPFRESCGADYFRGFDIRPYFQKQEISAMTLFSMYNFFYRRYERDFCEEILSYIPIELRLYGPDHYGDGHLVSDTWNPLVTRRMRRDGYGGVLFRTYRLTPRKHISLYPGDHITPLYQLYIRGDGNQRSLLKREVATEFSRSGRAFYALKGTEGYEIVSIYTFAR